MSAMKRHDRFCKCWKKTFSIEFGWQISNVSEVRSWLKQMASENFQLHVRSLVYCVISGTYDLLHKVFASYMGKGINRSWLGTQFFMWVCLRYAFKKNLKNCISRLWKSEFLIIDRYRREWSLGSGKWTRPQTAFFRGIFSGELARRALVEVTIHWHLNFFRLVCRGYRKKRVNSVMV